MAKEYLVSPKPSVRLACGNCGSTKIYKEVAEPPVEGVVYSVEKTPSIEIAHCEGCSKVFHICPGCSLPTGMENKVQVSGESFWKCPNCNILYTFEYVPTEEFSVPQPKNQYPYGDPTETYNTKGGTSMEDCDDSILAVPVGVITANPAPAEEPVVMEAPKRRGRPKATKE